MIGLPFQAQPALAYKMRGHSSDGQASSELLLSCLVGMALISHRMVAEAVEASWHSQ